MTNRKIEHWVIPPIPPEADAEFVAGMEDVLDVYAKPYDPDPMESIQHRPPARIANTNHCATRQFGGRFQSFGRYEQL